MTIVWDNPGRQRFVSVSIFELGHTVVLSDIKYWNEHYDDLRQWCNTYNSKLEGMTVAIPDDKTYNLFLLRWS